MTKYLLHCLVMIRSCTAQITLKLRRKAQNNTKYHYLLLLPYLLTMFSHCSVNILSWLQWIFVKSSRLLWITVMTAIGLNTKKKLHIFAVFWEDTETHQGCRCNILHTKKTQGNKDGCTGPQMPAIQGRFKKVITQCKNVNANFAYPQYTNEIKGNCSKGIPALRLYWNLEMLVLEEREKPENPGKNLSEKRTNKLNQHIASRPGIKPGPHWWLASGLTTAQNPSLASTKIAIVWVDIRFPTEGHSHKVPPVKSKHFLTLPNLCHSICFCWNLNQENEKQQWLMVSKFPLSSLGSLHATEKFT